MKRVLWGLIVVFGVLVLVGGIIKGLRKGEQAAVEKAPPSSSVVASQASKPSRADAERSVGALDYVILAEDIYDAPIKTQVTLKLLVSGTITRASLDQVLRSLHDQVAARRGFRYHPNPTHIFIYAFTSRERASSGQWIAMLAKTRFDPAPKLSFDDRQLTQLYAKPETRFQLTESERVAIFQEIVRAQDRARTEAERRYPFQFVKQAEEQDRLTELYLKNLAEKYGLTRNELREIANEGIKKGWPLPPPP